MTDFRNTNQLEIDIDVVQKQILNHRQVLMNATDVLHLNPRSSDAIDNYMNAENKLKDLYDELEELQQQYDFIRHLGLGCI